MGIVEHCASRPVAVRIATTNVRSGQERCVLMHILGCYALQHENHRLDLKFA
jgi:hypothetical protein